MDYKQILFDRVGDYLAHKQVSVDYDQQFINTMSQWPDFGFGYFDINSDNEMTIQRYGLHVDTITIEKPFIKKVKELVQNGGRLAIRFFVLYTDVIDYPEEVMDLIEKHIILLACYSSPDRRYHELMIPDFYSLNESHRSVYRKTSVVTTPLLERCPKAKFRGSQTGGSYNMEAVKTLTLPRLHAVHLSKQHPDLLDVRFINSYDIQSNGDEEYIRYMYKTFGKPPSYEHMDTFTSHRYLLSLDGNGATYARPEIIMASGSVPLIQTRFVKYWSLFLKDGVNYVHVLSDLSNLLSTIQHLNKNPTRAQEIATHARELAREILSPEFQDEYLWYVFESIQMRGDRT